MRQSPAVLDNLFQQIDLDPWQPPVKGSKVVPFRTIISEWAKDRKVSPQGERSFTAKAAQDRERVLQAALASDHPLIKWANLLAGCQGMRLAEIVEADCRDVRMRGWRYRDEEGKVHPIAELRDENKITKRRRA